MILEGRGWVLRTGGDGPWAGWLSLRRLDVSASFREAPWLALRAFAEVAGAFPGGVALLWDAPRTWLEGVAPEARASFLGTLASLSRAGVHVTDALFSEWVDGPLDLWYHGVNAPTGDLGHAWRHGWIGWVPQGEQDWTLPGLGTTARMPEGEWEASSGALWGELSLPFGALGALEGEELARVMAETQARLERDLSQRMVCGAWPPAFPFHRKRAGWRLGLLGGREYLAAGGTWELAAERLNALLETLRRVLKCPLQAGPVSDLEVAGLLGHQAMREGLPWRYSLALPPASPAFSPGVGTDPREPSPLEARSSFPSALHGLLSDPPVAYLRLPSIPQEASVAAFLRGQSLLPALKWLPPDVSPPGPFRAERPWASASAFAPLMDVTQALQPGLFEDWE